MKVFSLSFDDDRPGEYLLKGFRKDIYVYANGRYYSMEIITTRRILQEIVFLVYYYGYYYFEDNCIVTKEIDNQSVIELFSKLDDRYFEPLTQLSKEQLDQINQKGYHLIELI